MGSARNEIAHLSSAAARRRLGADLRALRNQADMTLEDVATAIQRSPATMSRLERGRGTLRTVEIKALLDLYGERAAGPLDDVQRSTVLDLVQSAHRDDWFKSYKDVLGPFRDLRLLVELETDARECLTFQPDLIPGLIQTEGYAAALAEIYLADRTARERDRFVELRMRRQQVLEQLEFNVVITELALQHRLGTAEVMTEQLEFLAWQIRDGQKNLSIHIVPLSVVHPADTRGPFVVMHFDGGDPDVVFLERAAGANFLCSTRVVDQCSQDFKELVEASVDHDDSLKLIEEAIKQVR